MGVWLFITGIIVSICLYNCILHIMLRHELREEAVNLVEKQFIARNHEDDSSLARKGKLKVVRLTQQVKLQQGSLNLVELLVYYDKDTEPLYNVFYYE